VDGRKVLPRDTEADLGGVDDMTKLVYLHEPGVLCNLARRYTLNEIYVSVCTLSTLSLFDLTMLIYPLVPLHISRFLYEVVSSIIWPCKITYCGQCMWNEGSCSFLDLCY